MGSIFCPFPTLDGFFFGREVPKIHNFTINVYLRPPRFTSFRMRYPLDPACVIGSYFLIAHILLVRCFAQIFYAIVNRIAIDMVNLAIRPSAVYVQPCETMGELIRKWSYANLAISLFIKTGGYCLFGKPGIPSFINSLKPGPKHPRKPNKNSCFRVIMDKFTQLFGCDKLFLGHVDIRSMFACQGSR